MARDLFHNVVRSALEKDNWLITDDPLNIKCGGVDVEIDLGAERLLAAEKQGDKIAVEVKNFTSASKISEFHTALGQFINYRTALRIKEQDRTLYLAVPRVLVMTQSIEQQSAKQIVLPPLFPDHTQLPDIVI